MSEKNPIEELRSAQDILGEMLGGLPGAFPAPAETVDGSELEKLATAVKEYRVRYANFRVSDESGNPELESVMKKILEGKFVYGSEQLTFNKDGVAFVLVKWFEPLEPKAKK